MARAVKTAAPIRSSEGGDRGRDHAPSADRFGSACGGRVGVRRSEPRWRRRAIREASRGPGQDCSDDDERDDDCARDHGRSSTTETTSASARGQLACGDGAHRPRAEVTTSARLTSPYPAESRFDRSGTEGRIRGIGVHVGDGVHRAVWVERLRLPTTVTSPSRCRVVPRPRSRRSVRPLQGGGRDRARWQGDCVGRLRG